MLKKFHKILHLPLSKIPICYYFFVFICLMDIIMICKSCFNLCILPNNLAYHFLTYYDLGFIPRAFYGSTLGLLTQILPFKIYSCVWLLVILFSHGIIFILYLAARKKNINTIYLDLLILFAVTLPTTALPVSDFFRLDILNYDLFLICGMLCWNKHPLRFLTLPLILIMIMIHEASLMMFVPTIMGITIYRIEHNKKDYCFLSNMFLCVLIGSFMFLTARTTPLDPTIVISYLQSRSPYYIKDFQLFEFSTSASGHIHILVSSFQDSNFLIYVLMSLPFVILAILPFYFFWICIFDGLKKSRKEKIYKLLLLLLSTSPNLCLFIGPDYNRWVASIFSVHLFLILMLLHEHKNHPLPPISQKNKLFIILLCFLLIQIGPGYFLPFSDFTRILAERFTCYLLK